MSAGRRATTCRKTLGPPINRLAAGAAVCWFLVCPGVVGRAAEPGDQTARRTGSADYAVVVSEPTWTIPDWRGVVDALTARHGGTLIVYTGSVSAAQAKLQAARPRYVCFVAQPGELGRSYVVQVSRMCRALDDDPYGDALWGIITGYEPQDALRLAQHSEPLLVRRAAGGCGLDLDAFSEGVWYSEGEKNAMWEKRPGESAREGTCPDDTTSLLVHELNVNHPDYFVTSGHATDRDWQIGYSYRNGQFRCRNGQLFGLDTAGGRFNVISPNPKVYAPLGNCLMGLVGDREAMALAWMRTGGVHQMAGYVVPTWYGTLWGLSDYFVGGQGRYSFAEAFFFNSQYVVQQLESRFPRIARLNLDDYDLESETNSLGRLAQEHRITDRDALGLLWDRDTIAFYGDPAWDARLQPVRAPLWECRLVEKGGRYTFQVTAPADGTWGRPPGLLLPRRVRDVQVSQGADLGPIITDDFILLPVTGARRSGERFTVEFTARPAP